MRRAEWTERGIQVQEYEPRALRDDWVRLRVAACGICGSDLHVWHDLQPTSLGSCPGHEFVGYPVDGPAGLADGLYAVEPLYW